MFKSLDDIEDQLYEVQFVKSEIENKEPMINGFFMPQYAKLRVLELYYNFFWQVLRCYEVGGAGYGYTFDLSSIIQAQFVWLSPTSIEKILELLAQWRLYGWLFSPLNNKFRPSYMLRWA